MHSGIEGFDMPAPDDVRGAADALRILADPTRLNILWALMQGETSVACLAELAGTSPTSVSQHLSKLRLAGLVSNRREGNFIFYALADHHIGELVRQALSHADHRAGRTESHQGISVQSAATGGDTFEVGAPGVEGPAGRDRAGNVAGS